MDKRRNASGRHPCLTGSKKPCCLETGYIVVSHLFFLFLLFTSFFMLIILRRVKCAWP